MGIPRPLLLAALVACAAVLLAPSLVAHTSVFSADGKVRVVVGQLNEPVSTYAVSGLDVCFQHNTTARPAIASADIRPDELVATLRSPDGHELTNGLRAQFGRPGCYTFEEPYVLTRPGQYVVDLTGLVNGTAVAFSSITAGGPVVDRADITFPDEVASAADLESRLAALEARMEVADDGDGKGAPAPTAALLVVGLGLLAVVRRFR